MVRALELAFAVCALVLSGCGKQGKVTGSVCLDGKPVHGSAASPLRVIFCPILNNQDRSDLLREAVVNQEDGTFEVPGGLPRGVYRISVRQMDRSGQDRFNGAFLEGTSPLLCHNERGDVTNVVVELAPPP